MHHIAGGRAQHRRHAGALALGQGLAQKQRHVGSWSDDQDKACQGEGKKDR